MSNFLFFSRRIYTSFGFSRDPKCTLPFFRYSYTFSTTTSLQKNRLDRQSSKPCKVITPPVDLQTEHDAHKEISRRIAEKQSLEKDTESQTHGNSLKTPTSQTSQEKSADRTVNVKSHYKHILKHIKAYERNWPSRKTGQGARGFATLTAGDVVSRKGETSKRLLRKEGTEEIEFCLPGSWTRFVRDGEGDGFGKTERRPGETRF